MAKGEIPIEWPPMKKEVDLEARVERDQRKKAVGTQIKTETTDSGTIQICVYTELFVFIQIR